MGKRKTILTSPMTLRIKKPLHDRLRRISVDRTIRTGKRTTVTSLIVEAIEQSLNAA